MRVAAVLIGLGSGLVLLVNASASLIYAGSFGGLEAADGIKSAGTILQIVVSVLTIITAILTVKHPLLGGIILLGCTGAMLTLVSPADPTWMLVGMPGAAGILSITESMLARAD